MRAAGQAAAERIRAAGPVSNTAASRLQASASKPARRSSGPLLAGIGVALLVATGAAWYFLRDGEDAAQAANSPAATQPATDEPQQVELEKLPGTSDADWAQIQAWTASAIDSASGPDGEAARANLVQRGREAFPALLAALSRLDPATESGAASGERGHRALSEIAKGKSLEWRSGSDPDAARANLDAVRAWQAAWRTARTSPAAWAELAAIDLPTAEQLFERTGPTEH